MKPEQITAHNEIMIREAVHPDGFAMDYHTHDCFEIGIILGGSGRYEIAADDGSIGRRIEAVEGMLLLWDGKKPHRAVDGQGTPLHQMILTFGYGYLSGTAIAERLAALAERNPYVMNDPVSVAGAKTLLRRMIAEKRSSREGAEDLIRAYMIEAAAVIVRNAAHDQTHRGDTRIRDVIADISTNYHLEHTAGHYADICGLSVRRFSELFKRETGDTFVQYVTKVRVEHAKALLAAGDERVLSIAFEVGYDSVSHFNETFRKVTGMTPTEYRGKR